MAGARYPARVLTQALWFSPATQQLDLAAKMHPRQPGTLIPGQRDQELCFSPSGSSLLHLEVTIPTHRQLNLTSPRGPSRDLGRTCPHSLKQSSVLSGSAVGVNLHQGPEWAALMFFHCLFSPSPLPQRSVPECIGHWQR